KTRPKVPTFGLVPRYGRCGDVQQARCRPEREKGSSGGMASVSSSISSFSRSTSADFRDSLHVICVSGLAEEPVGHPVNVPKHRTAYLSSLSQGYQVSFQPPDGCASDVKACSKL